MAKQLNVDMRFTADTSKAKQSIAELQSAIQKLGYSTMPNDVVNVAQFEQASAAARELAYHLNNAYNAKTGNLDLSKLNSSLKSAGTDLGKLTASFKDAGTTGQQAFVSLAKAIANADQPAISINTHLQTLFVTLKNVARFQISSSIIHGFMSSIQTAYGYAQDLNQSLNNIRIVTGQSTEQMAKFAKQANTVARSLSATTLDYTDASLIYYQQGLDDAAVAERTATTIKLANVSRQSAEEVSDQMTAIWNNFDNGSHSLEYYADVITALGATTASSSQEIAGGMEKFAAVAETVGLSYEYAASALATIVATTRQSEDTVGTGLRTIFSRLEGLSLGETLEDGTTLTKYSKALATIGVNIKDQNGELKDMDQILDEIGQKWDTLTKDQQVALAQTVGGVRQYTNLVALFDNWDQFTKNVGTALGSEGTLQKQADIYAESWEAARDRVKAATESLYGTLIDEKFFIGLDNVIEHILVGTNKFLENFGGIKSLLVTILSFVLSMTANKIGPAIKKVVQDIQIISGGAAKVYGQMQSEFTNITSSELASGKYSTVASAELQSSQDLLLAKTKLGIINDQLSIQERMRYELAIQGMQVQADEIKKLAEEVVTAEKIKADATELVKKRQTELNEVLDQELQKQKEIAEAKIASAKSKVQTASETVTTRTNEATAADQALKQARISLLNSSRAASYQISGQLSKVLVGLDQQSQATLTSFSGRVVEAANHVRNNLVTAIADGVEKTNAFGSEINNLLPKINQITPDNLEAIGAELSLIQNVFKDIINSSTNKSGINAAFSAASLGIKNGDVEATTTAVKALREEFLKAEQASKSFSKSAQSLGQNPSKILAYNQAISQQVQAKKNLEKADKALKEAEKELAEAEVENSKLNKNTLTETPRLTAARQKHAEAIQNEKDATEKYTEATTKAKKAQDDLSASVNKFNPVHTLTAIEGISKTAAGLGQTAMLINSIKSAFTTLGDESATTGEKITAAFMAISMSIPALTGLYGNFSAVLNGVLNAMAVEGSLTDQSIAKHLANALSLNLVGAGYDKKTASTAASVIANNTELFTSEALENEYKQLTASLLLQEAGLKKDAAEKIVDAIATGKLTTANIALKMSMIEVVAIIAAIVAVAAGLYALFDWLIVTPKEAAEAIEQATESYDKAKEAVTNLNNELETTKNRIDELNNKDSLTIVESQELAKLQSQNALLESQLAIKKEIAKTESKQLYKTFSENYQNALSKEMAAVTGTSQNLELASTNRVQRGIFAGRTDITNWDDYIKAYRQELIDAGVEDSTLLGFFRGKNTFDLYKDTIDKNNIAEDFNVTEEQIGVIYKILNDYQKVSNFDDFELFGTSSLEDIERAQEAYDKARSNAQAKLEEYTPQYLNLLEDYADGILELTDEQFTNLTNGFAEMTKTAIGEDLYTANYLAQANNYGNFNNITGADIARGSILYTKDQKIDLARRNIGIDQYSDYLNNLYQEVTNFKGIDLNLVSLLNIEELATVADYIRANNTQAVNELLDAYNNLNTAKDTLKSSFSEQQIGTIQELINKIDWSDSEAGFEKLIENLQILGYKTDGAEGALWDFINAINGVKNAAGGSKKSGITLDTSEQAYQRYEQADKSLRDLRQFGGTWGDDDVFIKASNEDIKNAEVEFIAARDAYLDAIETEINSEIKEFGLDVDEVNDLRDYLSEHLEEYNIAKTSDPLSLKEIAKDITKAQKAIDKASDSMDNWKKALDSKDLTKMSKAIGELKETYGELLDIGKDNITSKFAEDEENLKLLEDYINGDAEAYETLREKAHEVMTEEVKAGLDDTKNKDGISQLSEFESKYDNVKNKLAEMNFEALEAGANLAQAMDGIDDPTIDNSSFLAALTEMVNAAGMTAEEATDYLSSMGIDATVEQQTEELPGETLGYNITPHITPKSETMAFGDGDPLTYEFPEVTYDKTPVTGDPKKVPVGALEVTSANKSSGGGIKNKTSGGSSGGGGGGSSSTKSKPTPDRSSRYHTITKKQGNNSRNLDKVRDAKERYAGKAKLSNLDKEIELQKEALALDRERLAEAEHWLDVDRDALNEAFKVADLGITLDIDDNDVITNYQQIFDALLKKEQDLVDQYNKGLIDDDTYDDEIEKIDNLKDALDNWEETIEERNDILDDILEKDNELFDLLLAKASMKLELNLEVNDQDLELLDYLLNKIDDDAYKAAEAIALMGDKAARELERANYYQNAINQTLGAYGIYSMKQLANMSPEELQELGITSDTINNLKDWNSELLSTAETLNDLQDEIIDKVIDGFDTLNEKVQDSYDYFSHWNTVLENYRDIVDLNTSALGGDQARQLIKTIDNSLLKNSTNALRSSKKIYDDLVASRAEAEQKLNDAIAAGRIGDKEKYEKVLEEIDGKIKESQEQWLSDWSDGLQKAQDILTRAVEDAVKEYEKLLSPVYGSLDYLNEAYDRGKEVDEDYVQDYEKLYQLNKLNRDLTKTLGDTQGLKNREQLIKLQEKINKLQKDGTKMSEYDLQVLEKEFEVQQARIALEEAANAKSTVRLQRDNEGNWGYVYTSDYETTEELQQSYEDKLHEYQQLNDEYMKEMSDKLMDLSQTARDKISEIWSDATLTQEEKEARIAEVMNWFNTQRDYIEEQMGHAIDNQAALTDRFYETYQNMQAEVRDTFAETVLSQTTNIQQLSEMTGLLTTGVAGLVEAGRLASLEYLASMQEINEAAGSTMQDLANNITSATQEIDAASSDNVDTISQLSEVVQQELVNALDSAISQEERLAESIAATTAAIEEQTVALNNMLRLLNGVSGGSVEVNNNPLQTLSQSTEQYGINQPAYNERDWQLNKEIDDIFDAIYDREKWGQSHTDYDEIYQDIQAWQDLLTMYAANTMQGFGNIMSPYYQTPEAELLEQNVHIEANFPGVTDHIELQEAFENLVNKAAQFANRKRQG